MIISVKRSDNQYIKDTTMLGDEYIVDLTRQFEGHQSGDIICSCSPFDCTGEFPLWLEFAIRVDGTIAFRKWYFSNTSNNYLQTSSYGLENEPTEEQIATVNGLWSGRIRFEGLKLSVGKTLQNICPIDVANEERLVGEKIYLS